MTSHKQHEASKVAVVAVPLMSQSHLNQMLELSCLISGHGLPVYYLSTALHNRQVKSRTHSQGDAKFIHFHDFPAIDIPSPPPNPNDKYPSHLRPASQAALSLRAPFTAYLQEMAEKYPRVVVVHDPWMSHVVQDVAQIHNAESYQFVCISAFASISYYCGLLGLPFPLPHPKELPPFDGCMTEEAKAFALMQAKANASSGTIYNTSRIIEPTYVELIERDGLKKAKLTWAICPTLPKSKSTCPKSHECLEWLDKQEARSVIYVSFGTTVSFSDEEINELAQGLAQSGVKFIWVLRDADKCDVFDGDVRRYELSEGFGEGVGMVVREWAPQPQILGHPAVGGFMSHCGWNSCVESIVMGVPMAAWPMHSDQPRNAALVADVLKTGIVVREWKDRLEVVKAARIESVVRRLMASEEGDRIRKTAEEVGAAVREAGDAERMDLDSFIAHITRSPKNLAS
ncbi:hypothetical protein OROGR_027176 [Orobanche gracilis]